VIQFHFILNWLFISIVFNFAAHVAFHLFLTGVDEPCFSISRNPRLESRGYSHLTPLEFLSQFNCYTLTGEIAIWQTNCNFAKVI